MRRQHIAASSILMNMLKQITIFSALAGLSVTSIVLGGRLDGLVSSSGYYFTRQDPNEEIATHLLLHESFRFRYRSRNNLTFNTSGVITIDPIGTADPSFNLYALNIDKKNMLSLFDLSAGRVFVYDPSNSGRIDGMNIQGMLPLKTEYSIYAGGLVFADGGFSNPLKSHLMGVNLSWQIKRNINVSIALSQKARSKRTYTPSYFRNSYFGDYSKTIELPAVSERRLGLQLDARRNSWSMHLAAVEDLQWLQIQRVNSIITYSKGPLQKLLFEYYFRRPRIDYNSIFSVFDAQAHQQFSVSAVYNVSSKHHVFSKLQTTLFSDETSFLSSIGIGSDNLTAQYKYQSGYGGDFHWGTVRGRFRVLPHLTVRANLNIGNYKPFDKSWESLATVMTGVSYKPTKVLSLSTDAHLLQNRYYNKDIRVLVRVSYII